VIGLLNARLFHPEKLCQEPVLCCSRPLNPVGEATSRSKGSRRQCAWVRGASNLLHRTMIGGPTKNSSGNPKALELPSTLSVAGDFRMGRWNCIKLFKLKAQYIEKIGTGSRGGCHSRPFLRLESRTNDRVLLGEPIPKVRVEGSGTEMVYRITPDTTTSA
jgi:hypothetical protein